MVRLGHANAWEYPYAVLVAAMKEASESNG